MENKKLNESLTSLNLRKISFKDKEGFDSKRVSQNDDKNKSKEMVRFLEMCQSTKQLLDSTPVYNETPQRNKISFNFLPSGQNQNRTEDR